MKLLHKMTAVLFAAMLALSAAAHGLAAEAYEAPFILDGAQILSGETAEQIEAYNIILEADCKGAQLLVVTLDRLDEDPDTAARRFLSELAPSPSVSTLLLLDTGGSRWSLAVGSDIADTLLEQTTEDQLDSILLQRGESGSRDAAVGSVMAILYSRYLRLFGVENAGGIGTDNPIGELAAPDEPESEAAPGIARIGYLGVVVMIAAVWLVLASIRNIRRGVSGERRRL